MLQLNEGESGRLKIKSIRKATETDQRPAANPCGSSSPDGLDKPPC